MQHPTDSFTIMVNISIPRGPGELVSNGLIEELQGSRKSSCMMHLSVGDTDVNESLNRDGDN